MYVGVETLGGWPGKIKSARIWADKKADKKADKIEGGQVRADKVPAALAFYTAQVYVYVPWDRSNTPPALSVASQ
ncbi:hypothetical protein ColTof4_01463 [Colletotrichum tofieldiae]|nr:hypothetical protein ColTof3_08719 [Colletotrichum tofieldiae]GKT69040.1 hypothetical protein ColTof4_01463 [Colletotrichum tofieldiae]GKT96908.1 hypothetical protein Ct61P_14758 [Colletotrichum tofieldiae]